MRTTLADRLYAGVDLAMLGPDLKPDRVVTAADLKRAGLAFPDLYGEDMLRPEGKTAAYLGQAVAMLIFHDFARFRFAEEKLQFNEAVIRYGAVTGPLQRDPWGAGCRGLEGNGLPNTVVALRNNSTLRRTSPTAPACSRCRASPTG